MYTSLSTDLNNLPKTGDAEMCVFPDFNQSFFFFRQSPLCTLLYLCASSLSNEMSSIITILKKSVTPAISVRDAQIIIP